MLLAQINPCAFNFVFLFFTSHLPWTFPLLTIYIVFSCTSQCDISLCPFSLPSPLLSVIMTGAYNSFFRMFDRETGRGVTLEAWRESSKPRAVLRTRRVYTGGKRRRGDVGVDSLDFTKKILHMAWHPSENIIAIAATNNLYIFQDRVNAETQAQWWRYRQWQMQRFYWSSQTVTQIYLDVLEKACSVDGLYEKIKSKPSCFTCWHATSVCLDKRSDSW